MKKLHVLVFGGGYVLDFLAWSSDFLESRHHYEVAWL